GGSAEDLQAFNDEQLAREIAASRIPTLVGVGHEVDHTLADMVADVRAATPTNAAELLVPERREVIQRVHHQATSLGNQLVQSIDAHKERTREQLYAALRRIQEKLSETARQLATLRVAVDQVNPDGVLKRGYALLHGEVGIGKEVEIETYTKRITAEVKDVREK
ncbi:TPA: hypothetical protein DD425_01825, partial [Candidatus Saccharibacteria bacterium]|nr:hypothetical protein [Candidatus Saccharibacteria bacterium]